MSRHSSISSVSSTGSGSACSMYHQSVAATAAADVAGHHDSMSHSAPWSNSRYCKCIDS
jgi:hypothetical protein